MNIVRVTAAPDVIRALDDVEGLELIAAKEPGPDGLPVVSGYATDEAITRARALGAQVGVLLDAETRLARLQRAADAARGEPPPEGEA